jgi:heterodisulfide reductase subunit A
MVESSKDKNITIHTYSEVEQVKGYVGNFDVRIRKKARSVEMSKCTGCGACVEACPHVVPSEWDLGLGTRKAIYTPFAQAVPNVPVIDRSVCRIFTKSKEKCGAACVRACAAKAVNHKQEDEIINEKFGAIVVATGYSLHPWEKAYGEYGGGRYKDVITSLHFERMLQASGPTSGHVIRPSDGKEPKNVVFIQCVGSRDESKGVPYCSGVCCMYTAKQAILLKEHCHDAQAYVFYIDLRATKKNYEQFVLRAQRDYGVIYTRGRVSKIYQKGDKLIVRGADTLAGVPVEVEADLVVLATAIVPQTDAADVARMLAIPHDQFGLFTEAHPKLRPVESVTRGIFLAGACQSPMDIPESVSMASAAAAKVMGILSHSELMLEPTIAEVNAERCSGCLACTKVCPFEAITTVAYDGRTVSNVIASVCQGCGTCAATCPASAITLKGFTNEEIYAQIEAPFKQLVRKEVTAGAPA